MKFSEDGVSGRNRIQGYGDGWIQVNNKRLTTACIIAPDKLLETWEATSFSTLSVVALGELLAIPAEIILIGTGKHQQLPEPDIYRALVMHGIGFECMTTDAACRTHNVLLAEGRSVVTALFP